MNQPALSDGLAAREESTVLEVKEGVCYALFAYEVGRSIDLDAAQSQVTALRQRVTIRHKRRAPSYFEYRPAPLRVTQEVEPLAVGANRTAPTVDLLLYDFGAISVTYTLPFRGPIRDLLGLSEALYENPTLLADSRRRVEHLVAAIHSAVSRPCIADVVEPYFVYEIAALAVPTPLATLVAAHARELAQVLRSEPAPLSDQEVGDALACRISYGPDDLTLIDWDASLLFDRDAEDVRDVIEFANVELLEMRYLDQQLDDALDEAYEVLSRQAWRRRFLLPSSGADLRRIGSMQVDSAILFEGVNNALKLLGDQYLARVYRLISERFHLAEWDASILRKIQTLESIYQKMSDFTSTRRMEVLEWIIIVLITASILLPFVASVPGYH
jgi:hypothetical protein